MPSIARSTVAPLNSSTPWKPERTRPGSQAAMESLAAVIEEHFAHEERLMKAAACPSYDWHRRQHQTALKQTKALLAAHTAGDAAAPGAYLEYLARWLKDHVSLTDRIMSAQVRNHSLVRAAAAS